jgi:hypothetical protein
VRLAVPLLSPSWRRPYLFALSQEGTSPNIVRGYEVFLSAPQIYESREPRQIFLRQTR